jgi:signal transduction histidine kinase/DNA-binding response OmpR family regulator/HAMP domain-containing protein
VKHKDLKISAKITIGLSIVLVFVIVIAGVALYEISMMWQNTDDMYNHPLQVRRALGDVRFDILNMQISLHNGIMAANSKDTLAHTLKIDNAETDAFEHFAVISTQYLGPRSDYENSYNLFIGWKALRDEALALASVGNTSGALKLTLSDGTEGIHLDSLMASIEKISVFSLNKGNELYLAAQKKYNDLRLLLGIMAGAILIISLSIVYVLRKSIRVPLIELTRAAEEFRLGKLDTRSNYDFSNEFGKLSDSFNSLAETIQDEIKTREDSARLADIMLKEKQLGSFCREVLSTLLQKTGSQIGAFYFLNDEKKDFVLFESIGLKADGPKTFSAISFEGEFGAALKTRQIRHIKEIPADTAFGLRAVSADLMPAEIITVPILSGNEIMAMISLASVHRYSETSIMLINNISAMLTARLAGVMAFEKQKIMAQRLEIQNTELEEKSKELVVQASELSEQNTELEMQKKQLDETNRLKSTFLSNMSHELRTPLNSVIGLSGVLGRRLLNKIPEEEYSYIDVIERSGNQLLDLINDILDLSRIEAGKEEISLSRFSIPELTESVLFTIESQAREKNLKLKNLINDESGLPLISSDFKKCRHILQNIVANAVKFTNSGLVEISALKSNDSISIIVRDTGIGIAEEKLPYIFDEFHMVDVSSSRKHGGTGLGLSIAQKYAKLLHGEITVESAPGKGSEFTVRLPVTIPGFSEESLKADPAHALLPFKIRDRRSSLRAGDKTILLVEDSEPAIIQISDILGGHGYGLSISRNGKEALEKIEESIPDAIILDLMMPEIDGFEVLRIIRDKDKTANIPVLILTAKHITHEELSFLKGNNIHELIQKGNISKQELLDIIRNMLYPDLGKKNIASQKHSIPQKHPVPQKNGRAKILVIEDNADNMKTVRALLQENFDIIEAVDGESGIIQAKSHVPDLILLDISLPAMDGFAVYDEIKKEDNLKHIPIMALTARVMKGAREEILNYGFNGYLSKPVDEELLQKTIKEAIHDN